MTFIEYKEQLLNYLYQEKTLMERDIELHQNLSDEEKIEQGYLIKNCEVTNFIDGVYELNAQVNNTKLRAGDRVAFIGKGSNTSINATVIENFFTQLSVETKGELLVSLKYDVYVIRNTGPRHISTGWRTFRTGASAVRSGGDTGSRHGTKMPPMKCMWA